MKKNKLDKKTGIGLIVGVILLLVVLVWLKKDEVAKNLVTSSKDQEGLALISQSNQVNKVAPQQFQSLVIDDDIFTIDVHTPQQTHIPGTDAFIPFNQISQNLDQLPADKSTPIAVYCRSGGMSASASQELVDLGYTTVYDLVGGVNAYKQEADSSISVWPETQDLGDVIYGDVETTLFTLTNFTNLPLEITRVSTSCGCTKAEVEEKNLGSFESTAINVSFDPAVHKDDTDLGELTRTIYVETDNPDYKKFEVTITANVYKQ